MSDYKPKIKISEALSIMDSMLTVRRKDTRVKSADAIETVLYDYYRKCEKLDKLENIVEAYKTDNPKEPYYDTEVYMDNIVEVIEHE